MLIHLKYGLFVLMLWSSHLFAAAPIVILDFEGLTHTKEDFLRQLIHCKKGLEYTAAAVATDEQLMRNLNLFFSVHSRVTFVDSLAGHHLTFVIKEAKYVYPIVSISGFKDVFKLVLGVNNINWRGRNQTIGFVYQYYDRHSLSIFQKTPRHKNGKTGHEISINKYSTVEPLYFDGTKALFNFDNYSLSVGGNYWLSAKWNLKVGGILMMEHYKQLEDAEDIQFDGIEFEKNIEFNLYKYQVRTGISFNGIDQHFEFLNGFRFDLNLETIQTHDQPAASFYKVMTRLGYFARFNKKGNLALNYSLSIATNNESPFSPFVLDGFLNVRGIGNRVSRGTAEQIINLEYRQTLFEIKHVLIQGVGFTDIGSLRQPGASLSSMYSHSEMNYFSGLGVRFHSKFLYKTIFRIDYAVSLKDAYDNGIAFGLGHFF